MKRKTCKITIKVPREEDVRPDPQFLREVHRILDLQLRAHVEGSLPIFLDAFRRRDYELLMAMDKLLRSIRGEE
jgi:hypothetical protein